MRVYTITLPVSYEIHFPKWRKRSNAVFPVCAVSLWVREEVCDLGSLCLETTHVHWVPVHKVHEPAWPPHKAEIVIRGSVDVSSILWCVMCSFVCTRLQRTIMLLYYFHCSYSAPEILIYEHTLSAVHAVRICFPAWDRRFETGTSMLMTSSPQTHAPHLFSPAVKRG